MLYFLLIVVLVGLVVTGLFLLVTKQCFIMTKDFVFIFERNSRNTK